MMSRQTPISKITAIRQAIRRFMVGEDGIAGAAMIEFTLFAPLLVVMSIYTTDFGLLMYRQMQVQNAAQAGANWAISNRIFNDARIRAAVTNATTYTDISVSSVIEECGCPSSTGVNVTLTPYTGGSCPVCGGSVGGLYVTVQTQATWNSFTRYD